MERRREGEKEPFLICPLLISLLYGEAAVFTLECARWIKVHHFPKFELTPAVQQHLSFNEKKHIGFGHHITNYLISINLWTLFQKKNNLWTSTVTKW